MLLILKDKKVSVSGAERTVKILKEKLSQKNIDADIASFEEIELFIQKNEIKCFVNNQPLEKYNLIFYRRVGQNRTMAFILSSIAKKAGIPFIDKLYEETNEPGKLKQTCVLALGGISVPKTYYNSQWTKEAISRASDFLEWPMVIKTSISRKGQGVYLAKNENEAWKIIKENGKSETIIQEFIPNEFDYRILVLGDEIGCAIRRERQDKKEEFRNNVSLGASENFLDVKKLDEKIRDISLKAAAIANIQVAGVDVVVDSRGKSFVFEVNRSPAFTFDEKISNELSQVAEYLFQCHKKIKK